MTPVDVDTREDDSDVEQQEDKAASGAKREGHLDANSLSNNGDELERASTRSKRLEQPTITLALTVDATSDPEKLEKQLKLLRQYGVI